MTDPFIPIMIFTLLISGYILGGINVYVHMKEDKKETKCQSCKERDIIDREDGRVRRILLCTECTVLGYW